MIANSDSFKVEIKENIIKKEGKEIFQEQKFVTSQMWIWKGNKLRAVNLGEISPDEILELSFDDDDLSTKHIRMPNHKTHLYTSQTGPSSATIETENSVSLSERIPS